jgi:hypothetical protein
MPILGIISSSKSKGITPYQTNLQAWYDAANNDSYSGSGSTWYDLTNNNNDLALQGAYSWTDGVFDWTASGAYGTKTSPTNMPFGSSQYTYTIWTKYSGSRNGQGLMGMGAASNNNINNFKWGTTSSSLTNYWYANDYTQSITTANSDTWYMLTCGWDGSNRYIYRNGTSQGSAAASGKNTTTSTLYVGTTSLDPSIQAYVGVVLIYDTWIGGTEINNNFEKYKARYGY